MIRGKADMARSTLVGTILAYILLVSLLFQCLHLPSHPMQILGSIFVVAGYGKKMVKFSEASTSIMESLLMVAVLALIIPSTISSSLFQIDLIDTDSKPAVLVLSHYTALLLFSLFLVYVYFQLKSHAFIFDDSPVLSAGSPRVSHAYEHSLLVNPWTATLLLIASTLCAVACAFYLVDSIDQAAKSLHVSDTFLSLVVIPFAGNIAKWSELITHCRSRGEFITPSVRRVIGPVLQIALFTMPLLVLLSWMIGEHITSLDGFQAAVFFLASLVMNSVMQDGKATYFEGSMLMGT
jgi:Ca2+:H+ antiporter